jgi:hypothetical protein
MEYLEVLDSCGDVERTFCVQRFFRPSAGRPGPRGLSAIPDPLGYMQKFFEQELCLPVILPRPAHIVWHTVLHTGVVQ